ncbi:hypothetical protein [Brevibacillus porteri]|uniref:hypothetical protein n=1 Tax=Brevibacillus porteri TaxID=2126350 RepID=UPI0036382D0A
MIKDFIYDRQKMIKVLIATGILIFISMIATAITNNAKFMGIGLALFVIAVFWNLRLSMLESKITVYDFVNHIEKLEMKAKKEKQHFHRGIYFSIIPMLGVGIITIGVILVSFFTIL